MATVLDIAVTGDLVLDEPEADYWLSSIATALQQADIAIGHLEVPHTRCAGEQAGDIPAPGAPPENLSAIAGAGFHAVTLAGNHIADCGAQGIADTIAELQRHGVCHAGAGPDLAASRKPAILRSRGQRVALLSYNCVGPEFSWATQDRAGCAFLPLASSDGSPVSPRADLETILPAAFEILEEDIAKARSEADLVLVAMHKGIVHTPARLAPYERPLAHAAIELGADAVIAHHAHIVRGIEFHMGKPIFHGLGNGCVVTSALSPDQDHEARREWARKRRELFGFEPDPAYRLAPFHPEAVSAFIGKISVQDDASLKAAIIPVHVEAPGRPVIADKQRGKEIRAYIEDITLAAGLPPITIDEDGKVVTAA